jgi:AcrR family transcriptional regulator
VSTVAVWDDRPVTAGARGGRRSSAEVRGLVLTAAREAFAEHGFDAASTREIATRAGVSATVLFRHFGSKQALYDQAVQGVPAAPVSSPGRGDDGDVRGRILEAARTLFSRQGYAKTSTREIARTAGVHETYLFRYFDTKANLFREAILDPFGQFIAAYGAGIPAGGEPGGVHLASRDFLGGFFAVLQERRQELLTLVATRVHEGSDVVAVDDQQAAMRQILDPLVDQVRRDCEAAGVTGVDVPVATRLVVAMLGGVAIFQDWLFPADAAISDGAIVDEMAAMVTGGLRRP